MSYKSTPRLHDVRPEAEIETEVSKNLKTISDFIIRG